MKKNKIVIATALFLISIIVLGLLRVIRLPFLSIHPHQAIPARSALFFAINKADLLDLEKHSSDITHLFTPDHLNEDARLLMELFGDHITPKSQSPIYISVHPSQRFGNGLLFVCPDSPVSSSVIDQIQGWQKRVYQYDGQELISLKNKDQEVAFTKFRNLFIFARRAFLVEHAISQLKDIHSSLCRQAPFKASHDFSVSTDSMVPFYLNLKQFTGQFAPILEPGNSKKLQPVLSMGHWLKLGLPLHSNKSEWEGIFIPDESNPILASSVQAAAAINENIWGYIPDNLATFVNVHTDSLSSLFPQYGFREWLGQDLTIAFGEPLESSTAEQFVLLETTDANALENHLVRRAKQAPSSYQMFQIFELEASAIQGATNFRTTYATVMDQYLLVANSLSGMERWLGKYIAGQTCSKSVSFLQIKASLPTTAHVFLFGNGLKSWQQLAPFFNEQILGQLNRYPLPFEQIAIALKWEDGKGLLHLKTDGTQQEDKHAANILWSVPLRSQALATPKVITNPQTQEKELVVMDEQNRVYLISKSGRLLWQKRIPEKILSDIQHIDLHNNQEGQIVFNTRSAIYVIDHKGEDVEGFPLQLQIPATNGVRVVDFFQSHDYHFFVACENKNAYGFDEKGSPIEGWRPNEKTGDIRFPFLHFQAEGKDFLAALERDGTLKVFKKNGSLRFSPIPFESEQLQALDYQLLKNGSRMVTADNKGKAYITNLKGDHFGLQMKVKGEEEVHFVFADVIGDDRKDYISLSGQEVTLAYYDKKKFVSGIKHELPWEQDALFKVPWKRSHKDYIGCLNKNKQQLFLMDGSGKIPDQFPLAGSTPFIMADLSGNGKPVIITGNGAAVTAYVLN